MKKHLQTAALLAGLLLSAGASAAPYHTLTTPVPDAPDVVEFFSFYCGPCRAFTETYPVAAAVNRALPEGVTVTKYHVSALGPLGPALSEAWAVAVVTGVADRVEQPLFNAAQRDKTLRGPDDIRDVFVRAGVRAEDYESARHSIMVKAFKVRQEAMTAAFRVSGTPSFYVKGRWLMDNAGIRADSPQGYASAYADQVLALLNK